MPRLAVWLCILVHIVPASLARAGEKKPLIIDVHMHVWSGDPVKFPFAHPYMKDYQPPKIAATVERVVEEMDQNGFAHCVLVQTINHGWDNSYLVECLRRYPKRFKGQGLIDPTDPNVADKLEYWVKEKGLAGVRFSPMYYQGKDDWLDAKSSDTVWRKAAELDAVFNFFIAADQLPRLGNMVKRHPGVKVVVDHFGRVDLKAKDPDVDIRKLLALAKYPNVYVKMSEFNIISPLGKYPFRDTLDLSKRVVEAFGTDRLLWGTGFPGATRAQADRPTLEQELDMIRTMPFLTEADKRKILGDNAKKLWKF